MITLNHKLDVFSPYRASLLIKVILALSLTLSIKPAIGAGIDLHAHLFMKKGMTWAFRGDFEDPLRTTSWKDRFSSSISPISLEQSQLDIVVASLYAHPLFTWSLKDSIRSQIAAAREFVQTHPNWVLATDPFQATQALTQKKRVLILALEGASGILENESDIHELIDVGGIRIVTPLHLTDDEYGGVAFLKGFRAWTSPISFIESLIWPIRDSLGVRVNASGISQKGIWLIQTLMKHKAWIDLSHASDASQTTILKMIHGHQPVLFTHTVLRKYLKAERGINFDQLMEVRNTQGFLGLMPSDEMLEGTPTLNECSGGLSKFWHQYIEIAGVIEERRIGIGSDFNGGIPHLPPECNSYPSFDQAGLRTIGQIPSLWETKKRFLGKSIDGINGIQTQTFLESWSKLWRP